MVELGHVPSFHFFMMPRLKDFTTALWSASFQRKETHIYNISYIRSKTIFKGQTFKVFQTCAKSMDRPSYDQLVYACPLG